LTERLEKRADESSEDRNEDMHREVQTLRTALLDRENLITSLQNKLMDQQNAMDRMQEESKRHEDVSLEDVRARCVNSSPYITMLLVYVRL
jgi:hypothetical protein